MNDQAVQIILAILGTLGVVLSGAGAKKLVERWFSRERDRAKLAAESAKDDRAAGAEHRRLVVADNEQARTILQKTVADQDAELRAIRTRELDREKEMATVQSQLARLEERSSAQAIQITALQTDVGRWNNDYEEMRAERDMYRDAKHDADNKLTPLVLKVSLLERDILTKDTEIARLRGQLSAVTGSREPMEPMP